tara:strand:- start:369 stop:560 length:192 start_codon:yes stop_codon:yes gene_type:complete
MKSKQELLSIVQRFDPKMDVARMRDIVSELELKGEIYSRISMQNLNWGLSIPEIYYLIDPIRS